MIDILLLLIIGGGWGFWSWRENGSLFGQGDSREKVISRILRVMQEYGITPEQLTEALAKPDALAPIKPKREPGEIAMRVFSILGGIFVLGGISVYIANFWSDMSSSMRIFITLGFGLALSALSCIAMKEGKYPRMILPLIVTAAIIETGGWFVYVDEMFPHGGDLRKAEAFVLGVMALQQWLIFAMFRRTSLFFFGALFSYGFMERGLDILGMPEEFIWMALGGSLICVSEWTKKTPHSMLRGIGYLFAGIWFNAGLYDFAGQHIGWSQAAIIAGASLCSLGYAMSIAGIERLAALDFLIGSGVFYAGLFDWVHHTPFELLFLGVAVAMMYAHSVLESRALLFTSTLAILGFIGYYTEEYFVNSIGWPVALILLGVAFFAVGTMALRIRRRATA